MSRIVRVFMATTAVALMIVLAGCSPVDSSATVGTAAPTPGAPATGVTVPGSAASAASGAVGVPLDAACSDLLDPNTLASDLGTTSAVTVSTGDLLPAAAGGMDCTFTFGKPNARKGGATVVMLPAAIADEDIVAASLMQPACGHGNPYDLSDKRFSCGATSIKGGWWYSLTVAAKKSKDSVAASYATISLKLEAAIVALGPPAAVTVTKPFDCGTVDTGGLPVESHVRFADEWGDPMSIAAYLVAGPTFCMFTMPNDDEWDVTIYPGAASAFEPCTIRNTRGGPFGAPITISGVASAFSLESADYERDVCASDGASTIEVTWGDSTGDAAGVINSESLATLSTLLVPLFAGIAPSTAPLVAVKVDPAAPSTVAVIAGDDCDKIINSASMAKTMGGSKHVSLSAENDLSGVGGISCRWDFGTQNNGVTGDAFLYVVPSSIANPAVVSSLLTTTRCTPSNDDGKGTWRACMVIATVNGWWYTFTAANVKSEKSLRVSVATMTSTIEKYLATATPPPRVRASTPFDCGAAKTSSGDGISTGHMWGNAAISAAAYVLVRPSICQFTVDDGSQWELTVYPGDTTIYDQCVSPGGDPHGAAISIAGVKSAYGWPDDYYSARACATDGTSTVVVARMYDYGKLKVWDAGLRKTASSLLVPVFAAAK
jgi:hypothetical protein